jgi:hypothetical protein
LVGLAGGSLEAGFRMGIFPLEVVGVNVYGEAGLFIFLGKPLFLKKNLN